MGKVPKIYLLINYDGFLDTRNSSEFYIISAVPRFCSAKFKLNLESQSRMLRSSILRDFPSRGSLVNLPNLPDIIQCIHWSTVKDLDTLQVCGSVWSDQLVLHNYCVIISECQKVTFVGVEAKKCCQKIEKTKVA